MKIQVNMQHGSIAAFAALPRTWPLQRDKGGRRTYGKNLKRGNVLL
jgi:hypothetical protein